MNMNEHLKAIKQRKDDEFYTRREDVLAMIDRCRDHIQGRKIYLPCDSPDSEFFKVFTEKRKELGISIIATWSDFRRHGEIFEEADIIITNPPFSQYRDFYDIIKAYDKDFIIVGPSLSYSYKNTERDVIEGRYKNFMDIDYFTRPDGTRARLGNATKWFTNIEDLKQEVSISEKITGEPVYYKDDNGQTIVDRLKNIPLDYDGVLAVPLTFLQYSHEEWEILSTRYKPKKDGKNLFRRVLIKRKGDSL